MGSREAGVHWSVFDGVKFIPTKPDALMAEINSAIAAIELARATAHLNNSPASPSKNKSPARSTASAYDACIYDESHRMESTAMAEGMNLDASLPEGLW